MSRTGVIYALYDPSEPRHVRYIGRTVKSPLKRLGEHRRDGQPRVVRWIREVEGSGRRVEVRIVRDGIPEDQLDAVEREEIWRHSTDGHKLCQSSRITPELAAEHVANDRAAAAVILKGLIKGCIAPLPNIEVGLSKAAKRLSCEYDLLLEWVHSRVIPAHFYVEGDGEFQVNLSDFADLLWGVEVDLDWS